ncbi:hypothetical protein BJ742DRAFT_744522 [Cladochytrium replicatum]|nr:hypothetical protein BJ742DRAFT_744522 [Cladochytrium replicatum]
MPTLQICTGGGFLGFCATWFGSQWLVNPEIRQQMQPINSFLPAGGILVKHSAIGRVEMVVIGAPAEGDVVAEFYIGRVDEVYNQRGILGAQLHHFWRTIEKDAEDGSVAVWDGAVSITYSVVKQKEDLSLELMVAEKIQNIPARSFYPEAVALLAAVNIGVHWANMEPFIDLNHGVSWPSRIPSEMQMVLHDIGPTMSQLNQDRPDVYPEQKCALSSEATWIISSPAHGQKSYWSGRRDAQNYARRELAKAGIDAVPQSGVHEVIKHVLDPQWWDGEHFIAIMRGVVPPIGPGQSQYTSRNRSLQNPL